MNRVWTAIVALLTARGADPAYGHKLIWLLDEAGGRPAAVAGAATPVP